MGGLFDNDLDRVHGKGHTCEGIFCHYNQALELLVLGP